jgi:hypothetical protein
MQSRDRYQPLRETERRVSDEIIAEQAVKLDAGLAKEAEAWRAERPGQAQPVAQTPATNYHKELDARDAMRKGLAEAILTNDAKAIENYRQGMIDKGYDKQEVQHNFNVADEMARRKLNEQAPEPSQEPQNDREARLQAFLAQRAAEHEKSMQHDLGHDHDLDL